MNDYLKLNLSRESAEIETGLIAALIADTSLINDLKVNESYFENEKCRAILKAIKQLIAKEQKVDIISLNDILKGHIKVSELSELYSNGNLTKNSFNTLQNKVISNSNKRKCFEISREIDKRLSKGEDPSQIYSYISSSMESNDIISNPISNISDVLMCTLDGIERNYKNGGQVTGMATGYKKLDTYLNGIEKKKYIVIGARPAVGKTAFSLELAKRLSTKNSVLYFSLEMAKEELGQRVVSNSGSIKNYKVRTGKLNSSELTTIMDHMGKLTSLKLGINDTENLTVEELTRQATSYKNKHGLDVVIVDYLTLLDTEEKCRDERAKVNTISGKLRKLAKKLDVAVICLAQLNRAVESRHDKTPVIADLKETGNIEQDANIILLLNAREKEDGQGPEELDVIIGKNRAGISNKVVTFNYYKETQVIDEKYV